MEEKNKLIFLCRSAAVQQCISAAVAAVQQCTSAAAFASLWPVVPLKDGKGTPTGLQAKFE
jgi:hypothetical protein